MRAEIFYLPWASDNLGVSIILETFAGGGTHSNEKKKGELPNRNNLLQKVLEEKKALGKK